MPRKRKRTRSLRKEKKTGAKKYALILFAVLLCVLTYLFFLGKRVFDGKEKTLLVAGGKNDVLIVILDPEVQEVTRISIPATTLVSVSRNLGDWKIGSVWELGENEKLGGRLLAETVTKNFYAPVSSWVNSDGFDFFQGKLGVLKFIFSGLESNLTFVDRVRMSTFFLGVKDYKKTDIDLAKTQFLLEQKLPDGSNGYVVTSNMPQKLLILFSDPELSNNTAKVSITNLSDSPKVASKMGAIIETFGAKVVMVQDKDEENVGCIISSKDRALVQSLLNMFGCEYEKGEGGGIDVDFRFGKKFVEWF